MSLLPKATMIRTERLVLRPVRSGDAVPLYALFNNWNVIQWLSNPPWPYHLEDMVGFLANVGKADDAYAETYFVIESDGVPIGGLSWRMRHANHLQSGDGPNIGYWLGEPFWRRGFMTEAAKAIVGHIFRTTPSATIYSGYFKGNVGSAEVQRKTGFAVAGHTELQSRPKDSLLPHINTMLTREAFAEANELGL